VLVVLGMNGFLNFMSMGPVPALAGQFAGALIESHYMAVVLTLEVLSGRLLLTNSYGLLATTFIAPVVVNILLFHIFMAPAGLCRCAGRRALGCECVSVSSSPVAALPATVRRRRASGVARVDAELRRAAGVT
jgi:hypothetical protein